MYQSSYTPFVPCLFFVLFFLLRQFQFNKLFYGFLMVIDHIGRSKKNFYLYLYTTLHITCILTVGQIDGPLLIHLR